MDSVRSQTVMTEVGEPRGSKGLLDVISDDSGPICVTSESAAGALLASIMPEATSAKIAAEAGGGSVKCVSVG